MPSHSYTITWARGSETLALQKTYTADQEKTGDYVIPTGTVNQLITLTLSRTNLKSILISSDRDVTIKTNNSTTPVDTITVPANTPILYRNDDGRANIFTADVTAMYISNASGADANVKIRALEDGTP